MQSLITNGFTATQVTNALLAKSGVVERAFRFELLDEDNAVIRETLNVIGGSIRHVHGQKIKRGGTIQIDEQFFTLTTDYIEPNSATNYDFELSTLFTQITNKQPIIYWRLGDTSGTTAADASGNSRTGTYQNTPTLDRKRTRLNSRHTDISRM